jgi:hypothetical protein
VAEFLLKHEIMEGDQFDAAMNGATMEELEQMAEQKKQKSREENEARAKAQLEAQQQAQAMMNSMLGGPVGNPAYPYPVIDENAFEAQESEEQGDNSKDGE